MLRHMKEHPDTISCPVHAQSTDCSSSRYHHISSSTQSITISFFQIRPFPFVLGSKSHILCGGCPSLFCPRPVISSVFQVVREFEWGSPAHHFGIFLQNAIHNPGWRVVEKFLEVTEILRRVGATVIIDDQL